MRWRSVLLTVSSCALVAGCGGGRHASEPKLPSALAHELAAQSEAVAQALQASDRCGAARAAALLQQRVIGAVNSHLVPGGLQEPLTSRTSDLVARIGACVQAPAAAQPSGSNGHSSKHGNKHQGEGGD